MARRRVREPLVEEHKPVQAPVESGPPVLRKWTKEETRAQLATIESLLVGHTSMGRIVQVLQDRHAVKRGRATRLIARVREQWAAEDQEKRSIWKQQQIRSIEKTLNHLDILIAHRLNEADVLRVAHSRNERLKERVKDPPAHLLREKREYTEVLMDLTGTRTPEVVVFQHNVLAAVQVAIGSLTSDECAGFLDEMREMEALAGAAKAQGLLTEGSAQ